MIKIKITNRTFWIIIALCFFSGALLPFAYRWYTAKNALLFELPGALSFRLEGFFYGADNGFINPIGIAVSKQGLIYVADSGRNQIAVMDQKGREIKRIGSSGEALGKMSYPVSILITPGSKQRLIVSELGNNRIQMFDLQGKPLGLFPFKDGQPIAPTAMAMDAEGRLYVVDKAKQEILVYSPQGKLLKAIGKNLEEGFRFPMGLAVTNGRQIIVSDSGNGAVRIFDAQGQQVRRIPANEASGLFNNPRGIALDQYGNFYVTDALRGIILVINQKGEFKGILDIPQSHTPLRMPDGIAWGGDGLYVVDKGNGRVVKYSVLGAQNR